MYILHALYAVVLFQGVCYLQVLLAFQPTSSYVFLYVLMLCFDVRVLIMEINLN